MWFMHALYTKGLKKSLNRKSPLTKEEYLRERTLWWQSGELSLTDVTQADPKPIIKSTTLPESCFITVL